jgi:hypothetical protein
LRGRGRGRRGERGEEIGRMGRNRVTSVFLTLESRGKKEQYRKKRKVK